MELITPYVNDYLNPDAVTTQQPNFVGIEVNPSNGVLNIPVVYGNRKVEGIRLYTYVDGIDLYCAFALSEGYCHGINKLYIDDTLIDIDTSTLTHRTPVTIGTGTYAGIATVEFIDGRGSAFSYYPSTVNVGGSNLLLLAGKTINYTNLCYLVCKFTYTGTGSPYRDVPKVSVDLFGRRLPEYDTALSTDTIANYANPAYVLWDLLNHPIYGCSVAKASIDKTSFDSVKNFCNTNVTNRGSTNYKTFEVNWIMDTSETFLTNLQTLLQTYNMTLNYVQGKWVASIEGSPTDSNQLGGGLTFDENSIIGSVSIQYPSIRERYNKIYVDYPDRSFNFQMRSTEYPPLGDTAFLTDDGGTPLETRLTANTVTNHYHANDLAQMMLRKSRSQIIYRFRASKVALRCRVGDYIFINTAYPLINNQKVIITNLTLNADFTLDLECALWSTGFYPATFSNIVKSQGQGTQAVSGPAGIISAPTRTPLTPDEPFTSATYNVAANKSIFNESETVTFTITGAGVANGTTVNYQILGISGSTVTSSDLSSGSLTGTATINSETATVTVTIASDATTEGDEYWQFRVLTQGIVRASTIITVKDSSPTPRYRYTYAGMPTLTNPDWYIGFVNSTGTAYDSTQTTALSDLNFRTRIITSQSSTTNFKATLAVEVCLVDRLQSNAGITKQIFMTHNVTGNSYTYAKRATSIQVNQFTHLTPPTGTNLLKATRIIPTPLIYDERIDAGPSGTTGALAGCTRLLPIPGLEGHYTNSGRNIIHAIISYGSNPTTNTSGNQEYTMNLTMSSSSTHSITFNFFEVDPLTYQIKDIGTRSLTIGLSSSYLTALYINESRQTLKTYSKLNSAPF